MIYPSIPTQSEPITGRHEVEAAVRNRLNENRPYRAYFHQISFEYADGVLKLHGKLPTFYLKQLLQTILRDIDGVRQIDNRVDVVNASGLSGVRK